MTTGKRIIIPVFLAISSVRLLPHILILLTSSKKKIILLDLDRWAGILLRRQPRNAAAVLFAFIRIMTFFREFRSLFYYRVGLLGRIIAPLCRPTPTLHIGTPDIGPGLYIQHGFATIISARKIGKNCWVNQQVTIGYTDDDSCPTLGDNVTVSAGAKILGNVKIGDNSKVGANAVVVKNVPDNCTVVGVPAYIVRRGGVRVTEPLV